ncbi:MAG: hypothetical protein E7222_09985 [Clostridiales bacterium]|nr:hypothetical protein [Clostridiales bacterium]
MDKSDEMGVKLHEIAEIIRGELTEDSVTIDETAVAVLVELQGDAICKVSVDEGGYRIFGFDEEWTAETIFLCQAAEDGMQFYYVEESDVAIGEIESIVRWKLNQNHANVKLFESQVVKAELDEDSSWEGDPRKNFRTMIEPLINGSVYELKDNTTDTSSHILEFYKDGSRRRIMGIGGVKRTKKIKAFFNINLYNELRQKMDGIPDNERPNKSQPHITIDLELLWNRGFFVG